MSRKTPATFDVASEEFYEHVLDMSIGDRVRLEGHVFIKREDGSLRYSTDTIDYMSCSTPACSLARWLAGWDNE